MYNALVKLHNRFARAFLSRQLQQRFSHFVRDILHHVELTACPGTAIITLLKDDATMGGIGSTQRNTKK